MSTRQGTLTTGIPGGRWRAFLDGLPPVWVCVLVVLVGVLMPMLLLKFAMRLIIAVVVGLLGGALVFSCPYLGLLVFLGLLYLRPEEIWPALQGARLTLVVSLLSLAAWAINAMLCRERFLFRLPVVQCFFMFVAVATGSTVLCGSGTLAEETLDLLRLFTLFVLIVHLVRNPERIRAATFILVVFTAILGARTIWEFQHGVALVQSDGAVRAQATGIFGDPNDLALAMAMAMPLALGAGLTAGPWLIRLGSLAATPIMVWAIYLTDSRGGMLALGAGIFLFFRRRLGRAGWILGAIAVLALFARGPSRMTQMNSSEESAQGRVEAWQAGFQMLRGSPLWGVGKGQFVEHHNLTAHNSLMLCLAEIGLAGTAAWIGIFYFAFGAGTLPMFRSPVATAQAWLQRARGRSSAAANERQEGRFTARSLRSLEMQRADPDSAPNAEGRGERLSSLSTPRPSALGAESGSALCVSSEAGGETSLSPNRAAAQSHAYTALLRISLATFVVGGFFLSRSYTPPLYVYLALAVAAAQVEVTSPAAADEQATLADWRNVVLLTLGGTIWLALLVRVLA